MLIISLELGTGLFGLSPPLIFSIQATFSGALINIKSDLLFFKNLDILYILESELSPTTFLFNEKNGIEELILSFLISSIRFLYIYLILLFFKK